METSKKDGLLGRLFRVRGVDDDDAEKYAHCEKDSVGLRESAGGNREDYPA